MPASAVFCNARQKLVKSCASKESIAFSTACFEFDAVYSLDPWMVRLLLDIKQRIIDSWSPTILEPPDYHTSIAMPIIYRIVSYVQTENEVTFILQLPLEMDSRDMRFEPWRSAKRRSSFLTEMAWISAFLQLLYQLAKVSCQVLTVLRGFCKLGSMRALLSTYPLEHKLCTVPYLYERFQPVAFLCPDGLSQCSSWPLILLPGRLCTTIEAGPLFLRSVDTVKYMRWNYHTEGKQGNC